MTRTPDDPCLFVLGYGRAGTTLFRRMLSAHPALFVSPENDVFQRLPVQTRGGISDEEKLHDLVRSFPEYYSRIYDLERFEDVAARRLPLRTAEAIVLLQGASRIGLEKPEAMWGHKAPSEWPFVGTMRQWFPQSRYVHMVRHPHDSTASMIEYQLQRYRTTPLVAIWQWRKAFRSIRRHGRDLGSARYLMLRYEDLVDEAAGTLGRACDFLGVTTSEVPRMIDFNSDPSAVHIDEGVHMARAETALTDERVGRASDDYSASQAAMVDHVCRRELVELGYEPRSGRRVSAAHGRALDAACRGLDVAWAGLRTSRRLRHQL